MICPDGVVCRGGQQTCCPSSPSRTRFRCCRFAYANCCPDYLTCCPRGWTCYTSLHRCVRPGTHSSVLQMPASLLVNSTNKHCHDGTADIDPKVSRITPSQQEKKALKTSGFIGTSGDVFSPDEKYQCPDGTSTCELSSGIHGCCLIQNARWVKIMDTIPPPQSDGMWILFIFFFFWLWKTVFSLPITTLIIFVLIFWKATQIIKLIVVTIFLYIFTSLFIHVFLSEIC